MREVSYLLVSIVIPVVAILAGTTLVGLAIYRQTRLKELAYRERIAMIEKGLIPPPESDPEGFERALHGSYGSAALRRRRRFRSSGVLLVGVGLALMLIIGLAGEEPFAAVGVGGAIVVLGVAFFVNGMFDGGGSELSAGARSTQRPVPREPEQL